MGTKFFQISIGSRGNPDVYTVAYMNGQKFSFGNDGPKRMVDQIINESSHMGTGVGSKYWVFSWSCVSDFTATYSVHYAGTLYDITGAATLVNSTDNFTGPTGGLKNIQTSSGNPARNFVGTVTFSAPGYDQYIHNINTQANLSNFISITAEGVTQDMPWEYYID